MLILNDVEMETMVKEDEVARHLNLKVSTLRRWRWAGKGPAYIKIGFAVRYLPSDIEAFIEKGRHHDKEEYYK